MISTSLVESLVEKWSLLLDYSNENNVNLFLLYSLYGVANGFFFFYLAYINIDV